MDENVQTTTSIVCVNSEGERSFLYNGGSTSAMTDKDISDELIADADIVFLAGALLTHGLDGEPAAKMFAKAQSMGKFTVMDTAWDPTGRWMKGVEAALPHLDLFMPSIEEAQKIAGKEDFDDIADVFLKRASRTSSSRPAKRVHTSARAAKRAISPPPISP